MMMFTLFAIMVCMLKPDFDMIQSEIPGVKGIPKDKKPMQWMFVPRRRYGELRIGWVKRFTKFNREMWRKKINLMKWMLELNSLIKYPHYRWNKITILKSKYSKHINWRVKHPIYAMSFFMQDLKRSSARLRTDTGGMADWYFSASGDDTTGDGSIGTPWKTTAKFASVFGSFSAGDNVYFNKGDDFRDSVNGGGLAYFDVHASGSSGSPITVTGYGSGADPVIEKVYGRGQYWTFDSITVNNADVSSDEAFDWSDDAADGNGISIIDCNTSGGSWGVNFHGAGEMSNILVTGCTFDQSAGGGGFAMECTNATHPVNISFYNNTISNMTNDDDGIVIHEGNSSTTNYVEGPVLIHTITFATPTDVSEEFIDIVTGTYGEMYNINITSTSGKILSYGHSAGVNEDTANGRWHIHHCIFDMQDTSPKTCVSIAGRNVSIYNCLLISDGDRSIITIEDGLYATNPAPGVNTSYSMDGIEIYYCTLLDNGMTGTGIIYDVHDSLSGFEDGAVKVRNCIFTSTKATMATAMLEIGGTQGGSYSISSAYLDYDYNCYYAPNSTADFDGSTFAQWQTAGQDANGMEADPKLVDRTGATGGWPVDAKLQSDSPCINAALHIGAGTYYDNNGNPTSGITVDYAGTSRASDIGMYEYSAGDAPTTHIGLQNQKIMNINYVFT